LDTLVKAGLKMNESMQVF